MFGASTAEAEPVYVNGNQCRSTHSSVIVSKDGLRNGSSNSQTFYCTTPVNSYGPTLDVDVYWFDDHLSQGVSCYAIAQNQSGQTIQTTNSQSSTGPGPSTTGGYAVHSNSDLNDTPVWVTLICTVPGMETRAAEAHYSGVLRFKVY
jgi:hypothetical protein